MMLKLRALQNLTGDVRSRFFESLLEKRGRAYHARMARRAQHLRCYVKEANERTTGWIRGRRARSEAMTVGCKPTMQKRYYEI